MNNTNEENILQENETKLALPLQAEKPPTVKIIGAFLLVLIAIIGNYLFFHHGDKAKQVKKESDTFVVPNLNTLKPQQNAAQDELKIGPVSSQQQNFQQAIAEAKAKDFVERLQSSQSGGGEPANYPMQGASSNQVGNANNDNENRSNNNAALARISDPNTTFLLQESNSKAEHVYATHFGAMPYLIGQGKFIFANLAVAINSDLPGQMTAIVSQDVYGEQGRKLLIPRGSLLIGEYKSGLVNHQSRLFVVWTRLREPNGIDVMLGSEGTDELGRAGLTGDVDYHFFARFGSAILIAMIGAGASTVGVNPNDQNNSASAYRENVSEALAQQANSTLNQNINVPPTINVPQGQKIVVFVNRDLDFSRVVR